MSKTTLLNTRKMYIRLPATATAMNACLWISAGGCPLVIVAKMGTDRRGSRITNRVANE